ncbi:hypothetical protein M3Y99_01669100 [Aphelenchoides fujianensis]|nr:hypothetical protein M3Y99_01669100 [Aphelenchoides fujianensis]
MVLCEYNSQAYDVLGNIDVVSKQVDREQLTEIGKIILAHGYEQDVCVIVAHRHFNLDPKEAMLERMEGDTRLAEPEMLETIGSLEGACPNVIVCNGGKWFPVGYGPCLKLGSEEDNLLKACNDDAFLEEVGQFLVANGLENTFMLGARCSKEAKEQGVHFMEYNFEDTRTSETRPCAEDEFVKGVETTYSFARDSDGLVEETCVRVCQPVGDGHLFVHVPFFN